jgi:hypothetical protein
MELTGLSHPIQDKYLSLIRHTVDIEVWVMGPLPIVFKKIAMVTKHWAIGGHFCPRTLHVSAVTQQLSYTSQYL